MATPPMGVKLRFHRTLHLYSAIRPPASQLSIVIQGEVPTQFLLVNAPPQLQVVVGTFL
jgi:hypothetical protein